MMLIAYYRCLFVLLLLQSFRFRFFSRTIKLLVLNWYLSFSVYTILTRRPSVQSLCISHFFYWQMPTRRYWRGHFSTFDISGRGNYQKVMKNSDLMVFRIRNLYTLCIYNVWIKFQKKNVHTFSKIILLEMLTLVI